MKFRQFNIEEISIAEKFSKYMGIQPNFVQEDILDKFDRYINVGYCTHVPRQVGSSTLGRFFAIHTVTTLPMTDVVLFDYSHDTKGKLISDCVRNDLRYFSTPMANCIKVMSSDFLCNGGIHIMNTRNPRDIQRLRGNYHSGKRLLSIEMMPLSNDCNDALCQVSNQLIRIKFFTPT